MNSVVVMFKFTLRWRGIRTANLPRSESLRNATRQVTKCDAQSHNLSNIKYTFYSFEADLKTRKYGINPLFDCFHASYLPILMEIGTEVLIPKIA